MTLRIEQDAAHSALGTAVIDEDHVVIARFQEWKEAHAYARWMNTPPTPPFTATVEVELRDQLRETTGVAEARLDEIKRLGEKMAELQVNCDGWRAECGAHDRRMAQAVDRLRDRMSERDQAEAGREKAIAALKDEREKATNKAMARALAEGELCRHIDDLSSKLVAQKRYTDERCATLHAVIDERDNELGALRLERDRALASAEDERRHRMATVFDQMAIRPFVPLSSRSAAAAPAPAPDPSQGVILTYEKETGKNGVWTAFPKGGPGAKLWVADFGALRHARGFVSWLETGVFAAPAEKPPRYRVRKHADEWLVDDHEYPTAVTAVRSVGHMVASFIREGAEERARAWADAENAK